MKSFSSVAMRSLPNSGERGPHHRYHSRSRSPVGRPLQRAQHHVVEGVEQCPAAARPAVHGQRQKLAALVDGDAAVEDQVVVAAAHTSSRGPPKTSCAPRASGCVRNDCRSRAMHALSSGESRRARRDRAWGGARPAAGSVLPSTSMVAGGAVDPVQQPAVVQAPCGLRAISLAFQLELHHRRRLLHPGHRAVWSRRPVAPGVKHGAGSSA